MLDEKRNGEANGREACINADGAPIKLYMIPLHEELCMARTAVRLVPSIEST